MRLILLFIAANLFFCAGARAIQTTDTARKQVDSFRNVALDKQSIELQRLKTKHEADSLREQQLKQQIQALRSTDNLKKESLARELSALRSADSVRLAQQKRRVDSLRSIVKGFPVKPFLDTLFIVYSKQGSFTAGERAEAVEARIRKLEDNFRFTPDSLQLVSSESTTDLVYGGNLIIAVSEQDALWMNKTRAQLAAQYKMIIGRAVVSYQQQTSWQTLLKEAGLALLVIITLIVVIYLINRLFKKLNTWITSLNGTWINGVRIRNYELLNSTQETGFIVSAVRIIKWIVILIAVYLALPVLFGIFPWTRDISAQLLNYITGPIKKILAAIWGYMPNFFTIAILVIVFRYVLRFLRFLKNEIEGGALRIPGFYADWASPTYQIIRVLVLAFMLIVIFPYMPGSDSPIFKGVSVFVGVLFTFGSAGALGNLVAGLVLTYMRAFRIGDRVKIGEVSGDIIERTLLVTRIRTTKNEIISIPNSTVMNSHTVNYSSDAPEKGLILYTTVTVGYDIAWRQVYDLLTKAAHRTELIEKEPAPFVLQLSLDDYYITYQLNTYTKHPNRQAVIYTRLYENVQDVFIEAGIELMSPHFYALRDGHEINIPKQFRKADASRAGIKVDLNNKRDKI
ncbi:mechanosensitive ion channel family protein [Mucilaginibacter galii]|uniref:Ion channel n=1 Tax=Mucilaginibacter galii TaxID=2005073 RepID=A0A917JB59_9SPHI|nr:mechanosensitive ion channel family protein [Mucilaginibacter galii]GGI52108.1 ion channel [Mucilaginibacter galii]